MFTRRDCLEITGESTILVRRHRARMGPRAVAAIPGGTLVPASIDKFVTPLLIPPVMPRADVITRPGGKPIDVYEISMRQFSQQILPNGMPSTTVWGYGAVRSEEQTRAADPQRAVVDHRGEVEPPGPHHVDQRPGRRGRRLPPPPLPVDPTLHWANPPGGRRGATCDRRSTTTPGPYTGPVPIVTHVHGAAGVGDESDGYAEAWYLPDANDIPAGYATEARGTTSSRARRRRSPGVAGAPGSRRSNTRTTSERRQSGTTTTRSG